MTGSARLTAGERLERLLSIVPFVAARDGVGLDEIAERFDYPRERLLTDLEDVVFMVGVWPFTPDELIEVMVSDDQVWIRYADQFARPLRLSPGEALALVTAGQGLTTAPGADRDGPLARGLRKLAQSLGLGDEPPVEVNFGGADGEVLDTVRGAVADRRRIEIDYYSYGRDQRTHRAVDPYRVMARDGHWHLQAWCHRAGGIRTFRVDRIATAVPTGEGFEAPDPLPPAAGYEAGADDPRVVVELAPDAAWVIEHFPADAVDQRPDGSSRVTLPVSGRPWLERLLVRLGPSAEVVDQPPELPGDIAAGAATRILARYRDA